MHRGSMKHLLCPSLSALILAGCSGFSGQVLQISESPDNEVTATVSREGQANSRDAKFHIYVAPSQGGSPVEAITTKNASDVYIRWATNSKIWIMFDGGSIIFVQGSNSDPVIVRTATGERQIRFLITNNLPMTPPGSR